MDISNNPYRRALDQLIRLEWHEYKRTFNKTYLIKKEDELRLTIFIAKKKIIDEHNEKYAQGLSTYKMGVNQFTDLLDSEMDSLHGYIPPADEDRNGIPYRARSENLADSFDWRKSGAVTPVRNQGNCRSAWAFAAAEAIESHSFIKNKANLTILSPQNLLDCASKTCGCLGGTVSASFEYVMANKGIDTENAYSYKAVKNAKCMFKKSRIGATIESYYDIKSGDEKLLMNAVSQNGPVAASVDSRNGMRMYHSGVFYAPNCSDSILTHSVLIVGYGTEIGIDYWMVKNTWGDKWGEKGYIRMARNRNNNCGIATNSKLPIV